MLNKTDIFPEIENRLNLIKKSILKEKENLNLYLPLNIPFYKKDIESNVLNKQKNKKLITKNNENINNNEIYSKKLIIDKIKQKKYVEYLYEDPNKINITDYVKNIRLDIKNEHKKLSKLEKENNENIYKLNGDKKTDAVPFNLNKLKKKVHDIVKSVDVDFKHKIKDKYKLANNYKEHAISKKKNSKTYDDFCQVEKSRDILFLQKVILNIEYNNVVNKNKSKISKNDDIFYRAGNYLINEKIDYKKNNSNNNENKLKMSRRNLQEKINKICSTYTISNKIYHTESTDLTNEKENNKENEISKTLEIENKDDFDKDLQEKNHILFLNRYQNNKKAIKKEENKHFNKMIFNKNQIEQLIESKNHLFINKLKYDYQEKMSNLGVKKISEKRTHINNNDEKIKNKNLKKIKKIGKKIYIVVEDEEDGNKSNLNQYSLENYIKLNDKKSLE